MNRTAHRMIVRPVARPRARALTRVAAVAMLATLAACATPRPETRVTRFHLNQPIAPGQIAVEPRDPRQIGGLEFRSYADAVGAELARLGFRIAPGVATSELVAVVDFNRTTRESGPGQSPFSIGLGGGGFTGGGGRRGGGLGVGLGGGISLPVGKARSRYVTLTEMKVMLKRRSDGTAIWEGTAQQSARSDAKGADAVTAARVLAAALFQGFPGESGRTVTVK
ncbi:DUF4136 domain-containing protein [Sphingomonas montana]|uniref:DUF4136 domain-containing protein n=1 Tax=Sphingomonas montana TaxID=1843236 RepID=UPI001F0AFC59|nr:DUF4136 domain-containing protein [Sphingomonas montana]